METVTVIVRIETESGACLKRLRASRDSAGNVVLPELASVIREELARVAEYEGAQARALVAA